jgi:hypothetical protein
MGKASLSSVFWEWIAGIAFSVFLWANGMTQDQYLDAIIQGAKESDNA